MQPDLLIEEPVTLPGGDGRSRADGGLRLGDPFECPSWNADCASHPQGCFFHTREWLETLARTYGLRAACMSSWNDSQPRALIPFLETRSWNGLRQGVALPFTDFCPALLWPGPMERPLWSQLLACARAADWRALEIRGEVGLNESEASLSFFAHELDLEAGADALFREFDGSVRQGIRKAEREGVETQVSGSREAITTYYRLHCQTRRRHGLPPQPFTLFERLQELALARGMGCVITAFYRGLPVGAAVFLQLGGNVIYKFGASDRRYQHLRPNHAVMWEAIRRYTARGCARLHLGRTSKANEGLRRFKRGWAARERELRYYTYDLVRQCFVRRADHACGWHNRAFQLMPAWASRLIGAGLYRFFA